MLANPNFLKSVHFTDQTACRPEIWPPVLVVTKRPLKVHRQVESTRNCVGIVPMTCSSDQYNH